MREKIINGVYAYCDDCETLLIRDNDKFFVPDRVYKYTCHGCGKVSYSPNRYPIIVEQFKEE